jgi:zinc transport system substrate-binding protein
MRFTGLGTVLAVCALGAAAQATPKVATDIAPVHSIAARVMEGVGTPDLVVPPGASPHGYALRPSEARALQEADVVVWIGPALTPWLADPIDSLARPDAMRVEIEAAPGVTLLPARTGDGFEPHEHEHAAQEGEDPDAADAHEERDHDTVDGHLWLNPANATAAAHAIAEALSGVDPDNAATYAANAAAFATETEALSNRIDAELAPVRNRSWIVFHDAFRYFEDAFDIPASGSVVLQEGVEPSAARVAEIRDRIREARIVCAFTEPQFEPRLLDTVVEGTGARIGILDPIGAELAPGPDLYPTLLGGIAEGLAGCLSAD